MLFFFSEVNCDITNIGAVCNDKEFQTYVLPDQEIPHVVVKKTKLSKVGETLFHRGEKVESLDAKTALTHFLEFISKFPRPILVAHNCKKFDSRILVYQLQKFDMITDFASVCDTFSDTVPFMMHVVPGRVGWGNYTQDNLVKDLLGSEYLENAHSALPDARNLQQLVKKVGSEDLLKTLFSFSLDSVLHMM